MGRAWLSDLIVNKLRSLSVIYLIVNKLLSLSLSLSERVVEQILIKRGRPERFVSQASESPSSTKSIEGAGRERDSQYQIAGPPQNTKHKCKFTNTKQKCMFTVEICCIYERGVCAPQFVLTL